MNARISKFVERLSERAIRMGGTCTGEHGIGQGKQQYLLEEMGESVEFMKMIKTTFDPEGDNEPRKNLFLATISAPILAKIGIRQCLLFQLVQHRLHICDKIRAMFQAGI